MPQGILYTQPTSEFGELLITVDLTVLEFLYMTFILNMILNNGRKFSMLL